MIYLFTGRSGVFEPLLAAYTYLGKRVKEEDEPLFARAEYDREGFPVFVGFDREGNRVYTMGVRNYKLLEIICAELDEVAGRNEKTMKVIPVEVKGEKLTVFFTWLGQSLHLTKPFYFLAKRWVISRKKLIEEGGRNIAR
ncbi:DUF3189 family protein [Thermosyntropha sp.]|uniref:DUF3189 family protein n=1 Tax=Thermosyntropha sp. TaxID=2740820 RepID=UPI0025D4D7E3|nr:DUF3189 family protein [Thermosyntropha sp.]MBO8158948.1 DUF3189 family protein [Thermosyntropha sp.]